MQAGAKIGRVVWQVVKKCATVALIGSAAAAVVDTILPPGHISGIISEAGSGVGEIIGEDLISTAAEFGEACGKVGFVLGFIGASIIVYCGTVTVTDWRHPFCVMYA